MWKKIFLLALFTLSLVGCVGRYNVSLSNNSTDTLLYLVGAQPYPDPYQGSIHPDTTLPSFKPNFSKLIPGDTHYIIDYTYLYLGVFSDDYETILRKEIGSSSDTLSIYIFDPDTVAKYSWEEIRAGYKIIVRYDFSIEEIARLNGRLTYPR
ncbi:MAG: hypothetical protein SFU91_05730 [Chloroherpetonaceae bacterium]|nr:hypothetical protein [Chloroherpetonaceae bacterium]